MSGVPRGDWAALRPCGTTAAYRRHLRHGERPCPSCAAAVRRAWADRAPAANAERRDRYRQAREAGATRDEANVISKRKAAA